MLPTASTSTSALGSVDHTRGSPASAQNASRAGHPAPANSAVWPPRAAAAGLGHSRASSAGYGPSGPWKLRESPNTSSVGARIGSAGDARVVDAQPPGQPAGRTPRQHRPVAVAEAAELRPRGDRQLEKVPGQR